MTDLLENSSNQPKGGGKAWVGILISGAAIILLIYFVDYQAFISALKQVNLLILIPVSGLFIGTILARSVAWRTILQEQATYRQTFLILNEGYLMNNVLPFRLGEFGRAYLMGRSAGISFWEVLSTIIVEHIFDLSILAGLLLSSVPYVLGADWAAQAAVATALFVGIGFVALFLAARFPKKILNIFDWVTAWTPKLSEFGRGKLESFLPGLAALREVKRFAKVFLWMLITWAFNLAWFSILLWAFFPEAPMIWALFSFGAVSLGVIAPSSPGYIGVFEAVIVGALFTFGVDESEALAFAISAHGIYYIITVGFGAYGFWSQGLSVGEVYRQFRK